MGWGGVESEGQRQHGGAPKGCDADGNEPGEDQAAWPVKGPAAQNQGPRDGGEDGGHGGWWGGWVGGWVVGGESNGGGGGEAKEP